MTTIAEETMRETLKNLRSYSVLILRAGPARPQPNVEEIIWQHGRRNLELRTEGKLAIVCPVGDGTEVCGVGIFDADVEETKRIMDGDPGVQAGVFTYEVHPCRSFPGDLLP